jgi:hypothetical protein
MPLQASLLDWRERLSITGSLCRSVSICRCCCCSSTNVVVLPMLTCISRSSAISWVNEFLFEIHVEILWSQRACDQNSVILICLFVRCYHYTFSSSLWLAYPLPYHELKGFNFHFVIYISPQHNNSKDLYQSIPEQDLLMLRKSQNTFVAFHSTPPLHPSRFRFIQAPHCAIQLNFRNSGSHNIEDTLTPATHLYLTSGLLPVSFLSITIFSHLQLRVICEQSINGTFKQSLENPFHGSYHKRKA